MFSIHEKQSTLSSKEIANCSELSSNKTTFATASDHGFFVGSVILFAIAIYLLAVLILYVCMNGFEENPRQRRFTSRIFLRKTFSINGKLQQTLQVFRTLMFLLCIFIAVLLIIQICLQQILSFNATENAGLVSLVLKYVFGSQIVLSYFFLWIRQRLFYSGSTPLKNLIRRKTFLSAFSTFSLLMVLANVVIQMSLAWYWTACTVIQEALTWFLLCLMVQGTLCGLYFYPLWTVSRVRKKYLKSSKGNETISAASSVSNLIRRCVMLSCFCFVTDLSFTIILMLNEAMELHLLSDSLMFFLQNINSVINIACLLGSFHNWKVLLFPWMKMCQFRRQQRASTMKLKKQLNGFDNTRT